MNKKQLWTVLLDPDQSAFVNGMNAAELSEIIIKDFVTLAVKNCPKAEKLLRKKGYNIIGKYAAIPPRNPRLLVSLDSRQSILKGLSFHIPGSLKAKLTVMMLKFLVAIGLKYPLTKNPIIIASRNSNIALFKYIESKIGQSPDFATVYLGVDKITVAVDFEFHQRIIMKIAETGKALHSESTILKKLADTSLANKVPEILFEDNLGTYYVQGQTAANIEAKQISIMDNKTINLANEINKINQRGIPLSELLSDFELDLVEYLKVHAQTIIPCGLSHGDFAPWNIKWHDSQAFIYDWEDANESAPLAIDIFHFMYRQASLVGPWNGAEKLLGQVTEILRKNIPENAVLPSLLLSILREYKLNPNRNHIEEVMETIKGKIEK